jgi:hypothetical protein
LVRRGDYEYTLSYLEGQAYRLKNISPLHPFIPYSMRIMMKRFLLTATISTLLLPAAFSADRNQQVHDDKKALQSSDLWIYNDMDRAFEEARRQNKPLLIVYRCIP